MNGAMAFRPAQLDLDERNALLPMLDEDDAARADRLGRLGHQECESVLDRTPRTTRPQSAATGWVWQIGEPLGSTFLYGGFEERTP